MIGIVILLITLVAFGALGAYYVWSANRLKLPKGQSITYTYRGCKVHTVYESGSISNYLYLVSKACEKAVAASLDAWSLTAGDVHSRLRLAAVNSNKEIVIYFVTDQSMDKVNPDAASIQVMAPVYNGTSHVPMLSIRERYYAEVIKTGEPVIHEMLHALSHGDPEHANLEVWAENQPKNKVLTVQNLARQIYKKYKDEG